MTANRNPKGIRVGQIWHANSEQVKEQAVIKISAVFGELIYITTTSGQQYQTCSQHIKTNYSLTQQNELF